MSEGASFHQAAARFGVSMSSASRWSARFAQDGHVAPTPTHNGDRLPAIEAQADLILSTCEARPEIFLHALRDALAAGRDDQHERAVAVLRPPRAVGSPDMIRQIWFAGNHSDIGGSYDETESRLSDIALKWMLEQAVGIPHGLRIAGMPAVANHADLVEVMRIPRLSLHPSPSGAQHCEIAGMRDAREERVSPSWVPNWVRKWARGKSWEEQDREIKPNATVHPSVDERFAVEAVIQCDGIKPYRPAPLAGHQQFRGFYRTFTNAFPASGSS